MGEVIKVAFPKKVNIFKAKGRIVKFAPIPIFLKKEFHIARGNGKSERSMNDLFNAMFPAISSPYYIDFLKGEYDDGED